MAKMDDSDALKIAIAIAGGEAESRTAQLAYLMIRELRDRSAFLDAFDDVERLEMIFRFKAGRPHQMQVRSASFAEDLPMGIGAR